MFFFFKQKTAYEMRISDWSSDVCSSDLCGNSIAAVGPKERSPWIIRFTRMNPSTDLNWICPTAAQHLSRSEEHTSELQSLMRISYAVFCLKQKTKSPSCPRTRALSRQTNMLYQYPHTNKDVTHITRPITPTSR